MHSEISVDSKTHWPMMTETKAKTVLTSYKTLLVYCSKVFGSSNNGVTLELTFSSPKIEYFSFTHTHSPCQMAME